MSGAVNAGRLHAGARGGVGVGSPQHLRVGSRFEIVRPIGQGAVGIVYEAIDRESGARVALKTLRAPTPEALLLLKKESRQLQDLAHPALVTPRELFEEGGEFFFTMELVEGTDFLSYVRSSDAEARFDEARLRAALAQLATGLDALHADHKVHRDVKPSNVLVQSDGRTRILDFGIVGELGPGRSMHEDGVVVGTIAYMAPEQAEGGTVTPAADWYAVGAMLYEAMTGFLPFQGDFDQVLAQKWSADPVPPRKRNPGVPEDLDRLCVDLLRRNPTLRPEGADLLQRLGVMPTSQTKVLHQGAPFVGRREELASMEEALAETGHGNAVTLIVEGDSGVGKSTLVREFTRRAATTHAARLFYGRCYERESLPFKAVDGVVDQLARHLADLPDEDVAALLPEGAAALRTVFPVLEIVPAFRDQIPAYLDALDPQDRRARIFAIVRALFANLAAAGPVVLAIDDLQWADVDSLALLNELLRGPRAPPILLLGSVRGAGERGRSIDGLRDWSSVFPGDVRRIVLGPLPEADARTLIRELLGADVDGSTAIDAICAEAGGHPLFIDALARQRESRSQGSRIGLDDALWERISVLSPDERALMEIIAVAGVPMPQHVIARAGSLEFSTIFGPLGTLRSRNLVRSSGASRRDSVEPYHDRIRESVLARIDPPARKWWHLRIAEALEELDYAEPEKLAAHWLGAGDKNRAADYAVRAADAALRALAFEHAASLYRLAIEQRVYGDETLRALHAKLGDALASARDGHPSGFPMARGEGTLVLRARSAEQLVRAGRLGEGFAALRDLVDSIGTRLPAGGWIGKVQRALWDIYFRVRGLDCRIRDASEIPTRELELLDVWFTVAYALDAFDSVRAALVKLRYVALALRVGEVTQVARALTVKVAHVAAQGAAAKEQATHTIERLDAVASTTDRPTITALTSFARGFAHHLAGEHRLAVPALKEGLRLAEVDRSGLKWEVTTAQRYLLGSLLWMGSLGDFRQRHGAYLREAEDRCDAWTAFTLRTGHGILVPLLQDAPDAAAAQLAKARREWARGEHLDETIATIDMTLYVSDGARALSVLDRSWRSLERAATLRGALCRTRLHWDRGRSALAAAKHDSTLARRLRPRLDADARVLGEEQSALSAGLALLLRAGLARTFERDDGAARIHLDAAIGLFEGEGLALLAAAARRGAGIVAGGAQGRALVEAADGWMIGQSVANPERFAAMLVPGV